MSDVSRRLDQIDPPSAAEGADAPSAVAAAAQPAPVRLDGAMTIDVEDYFQVSAFEGVIPRADWDNIDCRVGRNVERCLELFAGANTRATFFTLGWVAQRYPGLIRKIGDAGHEVASHGMQHTKVCQQTPEEFRADILQTKHLLEDASGRQVRGFRAASFSIDQTTPWAHDVLADTGYLYSSSIYPVSHDHYGMPDAPRENYFPTPDGVMEIPITTLQLGPRNWPIGGGGYFRLYPLRLSQWAMDKVKRDETQPLMFYFHPWELDAAQPRVADIPARTRFRHYLNLDRFEQRLDNILRRYRWGPVDEVHGFTEEAS